MTDKKTILDAALRICCTDEDIKDSVRPVMCAPFTNTWKDSIKDTAEEHKYTFASNTRVCMAVDNSKHELMRYHLTDECIKKDYTIGNEVADNIISTTKTRNPQAEKICFGPAHTLKGKKTIELPYVFKGVLNVEECYEKLTTFVEEHKNLDDWHDGLGYTVRFMNYKFAASVLHTAFTALYMLSVRKPMVSAVESEDKEATYAIRIDAVGLRIVIMPMAHNAAEPFISIDLHHEQTAPYEQMIDFDIAAARYEKIMAEKIAAEEERKRVEEEYKKGHRKIWCIPIRKVCTGSFYVEARTEEEALEIAEDYKEWYECDDDGETEVVADEIEEDVDHDDLRKWHKNDDIVTSQKKEESGNNVIVKVRDCTFLDKPKS